jgi:hypothetical protein
MTSSARRLSAVIPADAPPDRARRLLLLAALLAAVVGFAAATGSAQAATRCPGTFTVLHNDRVGTMAVPRGPYAVRTIRVSCASASSLIGRFLDDFDGVLPGGWTTASRGIGFVNGSTGESISLRAPRRPSGGGGGTCRGTFAVEHDDRIGALSLPAGPYAVRTHRMSCASASSQFAFFLFHDEAGRLPRGWRLNVAAQRFTHGRSWFSVKGSGGGNSGGGLHPSHAITCPGTVTLGSGTSIGSLVLPAGRYYVNVFTSLSCRRATAAFKRFAAAGALPAAWTLEPQTATFLRGRQGFQVEPVS